MPITNQQVAGHAFLREMHEDPFFPDHVVDQGRAILLRLCERIETERPSDLQALYALTQAATEEFNLLEAELGAAPLKGRAQGAGLRMSREPVRVRT
jgi:hypothetical protein